MHQSPNINRFVLIIISLLIAIATVLDIWLNPRPLVTWNASQSVPIGWYYVEHRQSKLHEIAVLKPPAWAQLIADQRHYLPSFSWLLKPVAAEQGAVVCRFGRQVFINAKPVARAHLRDKLGRILPRWKGCRVLQQGQIFLLSRHLDSFDSRYFGPVDSTLIIGTARFVF